MRARHSLAAFVASVAMFLVPAAAIAGQKGVHELSAEAGSRGGVAASCGIDVSGYASRIEALLKHRAANSDEAAEAIANFKKVMAETRRAQSSERSINCANVKGSFSVLAINKPGWTVETDPH